MGTAVSSTACLQLACCCQIQDGTTHVVLVHTGTDKHRKPVYQQLISSGWNAQTRVVSKIDTEISSGWNAQTRAVFRIDTEISSLQSSVTSHTSDITSYYLEEQSLQLQEAI